MIRVEQYRMIMNMQNWSWDIALPEAEAAYAHTMDLHAYRHV